MNVKDFLNKYELHDSIIENIEYDVNKRMDFSLIKDKKILLTCQTTISENDFNKALELQELTDEGDRILSFYNSSLISNYDNCDKELHNNLAKFATFSLSLFNPASMILLISE